MRSAGHYLVCIKHNLETHKFLPSPESLSHLPPLSLSSRLSSASPHQWRQPSDSFIILQTVLSRSGSLKLSLKKATVTPKNKEYDDDEEEENVDVELGKFPSSADPYKMANMLRHLPNAVILLRAILSQFTEDQMSRYESFRRSALQKSNMRRLLVSITGSQKISLPMTIVVCGIPKIFVGELVETRMCSTLKHCILKILVNAMSTKCNKSYDLIYGLVVKRSSIKIKVAKLIFHYYAGLQLE